ncbi:hypothetical protein ACFDR9_000156 [Janthinobacterium sp. CG_23.3]|uniref:hypothetical protein n=1 Tax=Janthinobacterium sp. CG_23.3 TaxID=3349634 RepID=UPI0038D4BF01
MTPKLHPISAFPCEQILRGRKNPLGYASASIDREKREIHIRVLMDYRTPSFASRISGLASRITRAQFDVYARLANQGMVDYWSRSVRLNGLEWSVKVTVRESAQGMPITFANPGIRLLGNLSSRSRNPYPVFTGNLYYDHSCGSDSDAIFSMTAAHEIGHGFLTSAFGIAWSWGHGGTSSILGCAHANAPPYPPSGEIGLMSYYSTNINSPVYRGDIIQRTIASEDDVKTLILISGRAT